MVGRGREQHVGELARRRAAPDRGDERALGAFRVAHLDEAAEPERETRRLGAPCREAGRAGMCGGTRAESEATSARPWYSAAARSSGSSRGERFMKHVERRQAAEPPAAAAAHAEMEPGTE